MCTVYISLNAIRCIVFFLCIFSLPNNHRYVCVKSVVCGTNRERKVFNLIKALTKSKEGNERKEYYFPLFFFCLLVIDVNRKGKKRSDFYPISIHSFAMHEQVTAFAASKKINFKMMTKMSNQRIKKRKKYVKI